MKILLPAMPLCGAATATNYFLFRIGENSLTSEQDQNPAPRWNEISRSPSFCINPAKAVNVLSKRSETSSGFTIMNKISKSYNPIKTAICNRWDKPSSKCLSKTSNTYKNCIS